MAEPIRKQFKITELSGVKNLDHEDLFLVSDHENEYNDNKYQTRSLSVGAFMDSIANDSTISAALRDDQKSIGKAVRENVDEYIRTVVFNCGGAEST